MELSPVPVFQDDTHQFTGVALSKSGRMFVNYPRWQSAHQYDVVEVGSNGTVCAYPNDEWNSWHEGSSGSNKWVCVQAVYVDDNDELWVVDPGAPEMKKVQADGAKLVGIDLKNNQVKSRIFAKIRFDVHCGSTIPGQSVPQIFGSFQGNVVFAKENDFK